MLDESKAQATFQYLVPSDGVLTFDEILISSGVRRGFNSFGGGSDDMDEEEAADVGVCLDAFDEVLEDVVCLGVLLLARRVWAMNEVQLGFHIVFAGVTVGG